MDERRFPGGRENVPLKGEGLPSDDDRMECLGDGTFKAGIFGLTDLRSCCLLERRFKSESTWMPYHSRKLRVIEEGYLATGEGSSVELGTVDAVLIFKGV